MTPMQCAVQMRKEGCTNTQIAQALGVSYAVATQLIVKARKAKLLPPKPPVSLQGRIREELKAYDLPRGHVGDVLEGLSVDQRLWVYSKTVKCECETVAEFMLELMREKHAEDTQGENK